MSQRGREGPEFTWDSAKAAGNLIKHGVSFEEARTVFANPLAVIREDEMHSEVEQREIIIGHSFRQRLLFVSFAERENTLRIISARQATSKERRDYERRVMFR
ncbi:MAG: BrnT family toxin [Thermodesulfobacteriota bacterium]